MPSISPLQRFRPNWGQSLAFLARSRISFWVDLLIIAGLLGLAVGLMSVGHEWIAPSRARVVINLSVWALPRYTFYSLCRGLIAYCLSLGFTLVYGYWAAKDHVAEKLLVPILDILQSIPVLSFMPVFVLLLVSAFPKSNIGLELAAILMIFTGQAWNMTFSYYHSLRSVPNDLQEVAATYRFGWFRKLVRVELPFSTMGLVWNSMMSMAGGWFFLMLSEAFTLGDQDFRLPGLGSYMSEAAARVSEVGVMPQIYAIIAMVLMIVVLDQFLWRPVTVWAQKFRVEETAAVGVANTSWFLDFLRHSGMLKFLAIHVKRVQRGLSPTPPVLTALDVPSEASAATPLSKLLSVAALALLIGGLIFGGYKLVVNLSGVPLGQWLRFLSAGMVTLIRVLLCTAGGTLWALPAGIAIGLSPRLSRIFQPIVQIVASFPAPMLFPTVIVLLSMFGVSLNYGAVLLMLLGTQWYILFNVLAGALSIPADLREVARSYHFSTWQSFKSVYAPSVFPYLVTGWVTAAGGAWNTSIVAEYYSLKKGSPPLVAYGLGSIISQAAEQRQIPILAASTIVMSLIVVLFNLTVWRRLYHVAETRYSLNK